jgi:anaerobic magnesium-protoporphyrin IX monomethyl ester cyclase
VRIALVYPPFLRLFGGRMNSVINGLCILGAVAEKAGHNAVVFNADYGSKSCDMTLYDYQRNHDHYLKGLNNLELPVWRELEDFLKEFSPDILGVTCMTAHWASVKNVATIFKHLYPSRPVVIGGHHATAVPEQILSHSSVDYVVRGEGEHTFRELLEIMEKRGPLDGVKGLSFKSGKELIHNPARELINDIDEIPFAATRLMFKSDTISYDNEMVFTSRGCPHDCIFCASKLTWTRKPRYRSPERVVQEIVEAYQRTGRTYFAIYDDTFTINRKHAEKICQLLIDSRIHFTWHCMSTVKVRDENFYRKLKAAGCNSIAFGIETGDADALLKLKKNISLDEIRDAFQLARRLGFHTRAFIMYGFPWETKTHIDASINLLKDIRPDSIGYSSAVPLPGTGLFDLVKEAGFLTEPIAKIDWSHYHQYSPEMFFSNQISRKEAFKLSAYAERQFYLLSLGGRMGEVKVSIKRTIKRFVGNRFYNLIKKILK